MQVKRATGFTLIELMVVVVIVGVLATVAVVAYTRHIKSARLVDGRAFVATIQARQEAYFQQFGLYVNASDDAYHPALGSDEPVAKAWNPSAAAQPLWADLGARPANGNSYFEYRVKASTTIPAAVASGSTAEQLGLSTTAAVPWYFVIARGNLDGRGTCSATDPRAETECTMMYTTSQRSDIVVFNEGK